MAIVPSTSRVQYITAKNHGDIFQLGNVSNEADVGGWMVTLMPDEGNAFQGSIIIMRRPEGPGASTNNVGYMTSPYRRIIVNGVASDCQIDSVPLVGPCEVQVPANGTSVALFVNCTAGTATLYTRPLQGCTAF